MPLSKTSVKWLCVAVAVVLTASSVSGKLKALKPRVLTTKFKKQFGVDLFLFNEEKEAFTGIRVN